MPGVITTTITFADGDQVTSGKLNEIASGSSFTSDAITGSTLTVSAGRLKVGTITSAELGVSSVTTTALASNAVTTAKILDGSITTGKLANLAVTGGKIASGTIAFSNLAAAAVATSTQMQNQAPNLLATPELLKYSPMTAKCYGEFAITSSSRSIQGNSQNVASIVRVDSTHTTVTMTADMNSANFTVLATFVQTGTAENLSVSVYDKWVGGFRLMHPAEAAGRSVNFVVFGKYA